MLHEYPVSRDPLGPVRGILLGCALGLVLWGGIVFMFLAF